MSVQTYGGKMTQATVMGNRSELDKFLAYAAQHAHRFVTMEYFTIHGKVAKHQINTGYEVGTVNRDALMKDYVQYVLRQRQAGVVVSANV